MTPAMTFYFGLRSPYAWIAWRFMRESLAPFELDSIELVPFWEPDPDTAEALRQAGGDFLYRAMSRQRHLYILHDIKRIVANLGYRLVWPVDRPGASWELPHLAWLAAAEAGHAQRALDLLFDARWSDGTDICDPAVLAGLLTGVGLPVPQDLPSESQERLRADGVSVLHRCHRAGVFGLPYFGVGREGFWGVDRLPLAAARAGLPTAAITEAWLETLVALPTERPVRQEVS